MTRWIPLMKRSFVTIADFGPLMRRSTCIMWKSAPFRHRGGRLAPATPNPIRRDASARPTGAKPIARARTPKPEQNRNRGYWLRISKIARAIILGNNAESDDGAYAAQPRRIHGANAEESLIDGRGHCQTSSGMADPYGLITRWKTRAENDSPKLLTLSH